MTQVSHPTSPGAELSDTSPRSSTGGWEVQSLAVAANGQEVQCPVEKDMTDIGGRTSGFCRDQESSKLKGHIPRDPVVLVLEIDSQDKSAGLGDSFLMNRMWQKGLHATVLSLSLQGERQTLLY